MTLTMSISGLTEKIKQLLTDAAVTLKLIRDTGSYREQDVYRAFIVGTGGAQGTGSTGDIVVTDIGTTNNVYLHFKLPLKNTDDKVPFSVRMNGYNYGSSRAMSMVWSGGMKGAVLSKKVSGSFDGDIYLDSNGNVVLSMFVTSIYYATFQLESMTHVEGKRIVRGQIEAKVTTTATTSF